MAAIVFSVAISVYAWRHIQTRGNRSFAMACSISICWMAGEIVVRAGESYNVLWLGESLKYLGATILPVILLLFTRQYCGNGLSRRVVLSMCVIPALSWLVMVTNEFHHLFFTNVVASEGTLRTDYGPYFWAVHTPYSYALLASCLFTLLMEFSRSSRQYRRPLMLVLVSFSIPVFVNVLCVFGFIGKYTPYSFPIFFALVSYAIFRLRFLDSNPIAFETVFQTIRDGVLILDANDVIHDVNPAAAHGMGKPASRIVGTHVRKAFAEWPEAIELYDRNPAELGSVEVEIAGSRRFLQIDSTPITGANDRGARIVTIRDITDRHKHQMSLEAMAFHDPLTRVANRRKFHEEIERAIELADAKGENFAILYFDLNKFKFVNDTFGHEVGDEMLKYVAARVASTLRKPDMMARLGGDEFAILLHNCSESGMELVIDRVRENVRRPFKVGDNELVAELSIGTAFYPENGSNMSELLRYADSEMYRAKRNASEISVETVPILAPLLEM